MVRAKNTQRCILSGKHVLALIIIHFFKEKVFLLIIGLSTGSALFMVISSAWGLQPTAISRDVVPTITTICRLCKSCKVSDNAFMKFTMDMINI